jgi:hypothetical protein
VLGQAASPVVEGGPRHAIAVRGAEHGRASPAQRADEGVAHRPVDDKIVLRAADDAMIKYLAGHH